MSKGIPRAQSFRANIDRALHNLYQEKRTTLHPMTAIPIYYRRMFKGDRFDFGIAESILMSEPTFAPLLANWRLRFEWYFDSDANRYGWIDNNTRLTAEEVMTRKHHTFITDQFMEGGTGFDSNLTIGRGSICDYAGIAPGFSFVVNHDPDNGPITLLGNYGSMFNLDFHLTYLNIIRNYHVNKQFPNIPYISYNYNDNPTFGSYRLTDLDDLFVALRSCPNGVVFDLYNDTITAPTEIEQYYSSAFSAFFAYIRNSQMPLGGLFCTQFEPDLYSNLLARDQNLLRSTIAYDTDGFTIEEFRLANHLQGLYDKIFVSGGTDRDLSRTIWGIESNRQYDIPELLCVHSEIIGTNLIQSTTAGTSSGASAEPYSNVPGSLSGNINTRRGRGRMQKFTAHTSGSLMCIVSLTPFVDYTQNIERHLLENNFMDEFIPDMARKGFEDVPLSDYYVLPFVDSSGDVVFVDSLSRSVGKQIAWLRDMTATNRSHGDLSNGGDRRDWILRRDYESTLLNGNNDLSYNITPYGNPVAFQYPFVAQTLNDPNFVLQVGIMCKAYRPIPRRFMPNLGY